MIVSDCLRLLWLRQAMSEQQLWVHAPPACSSSGEAWQQQIDTEETAPGQNFAAHPFPCCQPL